MKAKSLKLLRIGALVMGWLLLISTLLGAWGSYSIYRHALEKPEGYVTGIVLWNILRAFSSFFSGFGNTFFAFLVAAVLWMIHKEAPVGKEKAQKLMIVCCLSYLADAIVRFLLFIPSLSVVVGFLKRPDWISILPYAYIGTPPFAPLLYAASVFVLFMHFTKMVTFESEVA